MKYRKKPVVIDAMEYNGQNSTEILDWVQGNNDGVGVMAYNPADSAINITTLEGTMKANIGDWIIRGVNSEFYPCKPDIFEKTYEKVDNTFIPANPVRMDFGDAITAMKSGERVARQGWNGKGMWIAFTPSSAISNDLARSGATKILANERPGTIVINGHIDMKTADGSIGIGWLASQADMLAEDWIIV